MNEAPPTSWLPLVGLLLLAALMVAGCGSSKKSGCSGVRAGINTVTGTLFTQARGLPASPLPDVIPNAVKLRATVIQAQHQLRARDQKGQLRTEVARISRDLDKAKLNLDQYISGIRQSGVGGYNGPSADTIEAELTDADHVADRILTSCG